MTVTLTPKGRRRRQELIEAASYLLDHGGPSAVTMRAVANKVGCSLSATVYYFTDRDELLTEAGRWTIASWAGAAERIAEEAESMAKRDGAPLAPDTAIEFLVRAILERDTPLYGHYLQLIAAGESPPVARAYFTGRDRLNNAVQRILTAGQLPQSAEFIIAIVDGAAVSALSEGHNVLRLAARLLREELRPRSQATPDTSEKP